MTPAPDFISLNGPDNVGKTTHLVRLAERWDGCQPLGAVHEHDPVPWARVAGGDYARWWFETSTTVELTEMLLAGHTSGPPPARPGVRACSTGAFPCSSPCPPRPAWSRTG
ncbi:hypothetical protein NKH18_47760 [Streptomyces sp. M10(2022)]